MAVETIAEFATSDAWGLSAIPQVDAHIADADNLFSGRMPFIPDGGFFSRLNDAALRGIVATVNPSTILEVGVWCGADRFEFNSTDTLIDAKRPDAQYFGIDLFDDGRAVHVASRGHGIDTHFLQSDSGDTDAVTEWLSAYDALPIDLLFIDGWHSFNQCVKDWRLAQFVRSGGAVVLHDINYHHGPRLLFDTVDERCFRKVSLFPTSDATADAANGTDYGMGLLVRR